MLKSIITSILFLAFLPISYTQPDKGIPKEVKESIQQRVDAGINAGIVVGVSDDSGTHFYSYGVKSKETKEAVDKNTVFEIGSISKTFTGIILAERVLNGEMSLDDPIQKYLPESVKIPMHNGESIKLVDIANHTSALPRMPTNFNPADPNNPYADYTEDLLYEFLNGVELTRDIGSQYEYSNLAMGLLGYTLAKTKNMDYDDLMVETIAKPLGMKDTRVRLTPDMKKQLAKGHNLYEEVSNWDLAPTMAGAGGIRSTAVDMLKYLEANMGKKKTDLLPAMQLSHQKTTSDLATEVGLAWHISKTDGMEVVAHGGATGGYRAFAGFIKGGNKAVVVLTNSNASIDDIGGHLLNPNNKLQEIKASVGPTIHTVIEEQGIEAGIRAYGDMKKKGGNDYVFSDAELNTLGYMYIGKGELEKAEALLKLNMQEYPEVANVYDSYGEVLMKMAIVNYKKSIELNPANQNGIDMLAKMGESVEGLIKEIVVAESVLESYVGKYELAPDFIITVTRRGTELFAQATGQPQFRIFPKSDTEFYLKVVKASVTFNISESGEVESLTLHQNGMHIPGKRM